MWIYVNFFFIVRRSSCSSAAPVGGLQVLQDVKTSFIFVLEDLAALPVGGQDNVWLLVKQSRHLVGKEVPHGRIWTLPNRIVLHIEEVSVTKELAWETTKYNNLVVVNLWNSAALSFGEHGRADFNKPPWLARLVVVLFNRVAILFTDVSDTAKNVNKPVREGATRVIVPANIQSGHIVPEIEVDVVLFAFIVCLVQVHSWASHYKELVFQDANRVSMTPIL